MPKVIEEPLSLSDEELAFEMIEITCDELGDLTDILRIMTSVCEELSTEIVATADTNELLHREEYSDECGDDDLCGEVVLH